VTHKILYEHRGINATSAKQPIAVWNNQVDLTEQKECCASHDDDRLVRVNRYALYAIELPRWLNPEEWISRNIAWKYAWGLGVDPTWPEKVQRYLAYADISIAQRYALIKLYATKKFRSPFRESLCTQFNDWIAVPEGARSHSDPFSERQWDALVNRHVAEQAHRKGESLYSHGQHYEDMGLGLAQEIVAL
jgi:hypothetical protein